MCVPIREASVPSGEDGLGLQGGPADGRVHNEIAGQFPAELAAILVFLSLLASILCLICLLFFALMVHGVHMLFDLFENIEIYKNTKGSCF